MLWVVVVLRYGYWLLTLVGLGVTVGGVGVGFCIGLCMCDPDAKPGPVTGVR